MNSTTPFIALEIHDTTLWEPSRVLPLLPVMERWGYNALVLHQNDLLDACTQLDLTANYGVSDLRLKKVRHNAAWLNRLVDLLARFDARLFLEIKEPSFHDYALELHPNLLGADGQPDPGAAAWAGFCEAKTRDLLDRVPGLGGLVVNLSSPESRVSMPDFAATQGGLDHEGWFDQMIAAFRDPLAERGKDLWVRDFSYTADLQSGVLSAINRRDGAVGASVKITAHDYFPQFPDNPGAALVEAPLIYEFEAFGEHMGWGVIPNCRVAEFARRMDLYRRTGAVGCLMRISWEAMSGTHALDSLSAVNVYALPRLIAAQYDPNALIRDWLSDECDLTGDLAEQAAALLLESWHIPAAAYWNGLVFPRHSCLPSTWREGWLSMESSGMGRRDRDLQIDPGMAMLSDTAQQSLFTAKADAVTRADHLADQAAALAMQLPTPLAEQFVAFQWLPLFARQFDFATRATFFAARARIDDLAEIPELVSKLHALAEEITARFDAAGDLPQTTRVLLDPEQIKRFAASLPQ